MDLRTDRRRQPLLRAARRLHPAPRPRSSRERGVRPVQDGKRVQLLIGRPGQPLHPEPDVRPDHRARLPRPAVPRSDPRGRRPAHADAGRAARAPSTGTATRALAVDGRAGPRRGPAVPDARLRRRGGAARRHRRRRWRACRAFNRWLEEDWGFAYQGRLIAVPMLSLADPEAALAELDSLLERGARIVHVRPAPVPGAERHRPLARRPAARPGVGAPRRGRRSRSRSTSATAATTRFAAAWGGARDVRGLRQQRRARPRRSSSDRAIHDTIGVAGRRTACSRGTRRCGSRASRTAPTGCTCW